MQSRRPFRHLVAYALLCLLLCAVSAQAQSPPCPLPEPTGYYKYVNDDANIFDQATKDRLAAILNNLKERADIEFAVVAIRTTGDLPIFDYSLRLSRCWGIGSKEGDKNGLLLVTAVDDRKYFTQVSRHLEGDLPDGLVGEIQRRTMVEPFRKGDYGGGVLSAIQTLVATLGEKRGFSIEGIDQSQAYRPRAERPLRERQGRRGLGFGACCVVAVILLVIFSIGSKRGRGGRGGWGGGGGGFLNALLLANLLSSLGGRGSSGWGGSSSGWGGGGSSSGWSGGDFGGFGGGGDFGGGGAGGSW